jgi:hypothetical protein
MRTATATTEQGTVTDAKGERREARRNTRPDGSQVVIYASTSRRVAPAVAATFVPDAEVAQPSQLEPAELEQHLAQLDELLDSDGAKALEHEVAHAQADEAHERQMAEQVDGAKVPHSPERKRRLGDVISVQCTCGEASPTATRREIDGWVAEHKRGLRTAA